MVFRKRVSFRPRLVFSGERCRCHCSLRRLCTGEVSDSLRGRDSLADKVFVGPVEFADTVDIVWLRRGKETWLRAGKVLRGLGVHSEHGLAHDLHTIVGQGADMHLV